MMFVYKGQAFLTFKRMEEASAALREKQEGGSRHVKHRGEDG
jgi:hypothetical protein